MPRAAVGARSAAPLFTNEVPGTMDVVAPAAQPPPAAAKPAKSMGFGEGVCTCARCMRRAGPIREDVDERLVQIAYVLGGVYADTPDPEERVTPEHRQKAQALMGAVEEADCASLTTLFNTVGDAGMVEEIATELIISAAQLGLGDVIATLVARGADVEERDLRRGGRPLMHAANNGHAAAVKALIQAGADLDARDDNGYTALMVAIFSDRSTCADLLLKAGAQVDAVDDKGRSALSYASMYGSTDCISVLAAAGADVFLVDREGLSPLDLAEESGRSSALEALRKLQLKVRMQERRRARQPARSGGEALDEKELARLALAAEERAMQLLLEEEAEKAKSARAAEKATKKKQKAKTKAHAAANLDESAAAAADDAPAGQPQPRQASGGGGGGKSAGGKAAPLQRAHSSGELPPGMSSPAEAAPAAAPQAPAVGAALLAAELAPGADAEALRCAWEAVLEAASRCLDEAEQPVLLSRVEALLPRCLEAGISVKYGRKVAQRLAAVGPAREALRAALAANPADRSALDGALRSAKCVRCLLEPHLLAAAEDALAAATAEQEQRTWRSLASGLSWDTAAPLPQPAGGLNGAHSGGAPATQAAVYAGWTQQDGYDGIEQEHECVVCMSAVKNACCIPCGHVCMCHVCANSVQQSASNACPVCRSPMDLVIEIID